MDQLGGAGERDHGPPGGGRGGGHRPAPSRWSERPLACVVLREGQTATKEDILAFLDGRVAKWWLPDDVAFVSEIPKTSVGKFSKKDLRKEFEGYSLPTA